MKYLIEFGGMLMTTEVDGMQCNANTEYHFKSFHSENGMAYLVFCDDKYHYKVCITSNVNFDDFGKINKNKPIRIRRVVDDTFQRYINTIEDDAEECMTANKCLKEELAMKEQEIIEYHKTCQQLSHHITKTCETKEYVAELEQSLQECRVSIQFLRKLADECKILRISAVDELKLTLKRIDELVNEKEELTRELTKAKARYENEVFQRDVDAVKFNEENKKLDTLLGMEKLAKVKLQFDTDIYILRLHTIIGELQAKIAELEAKQNTYIMVVNE